MIAIRWWLSMSEPVPEDLLPVGSTLTIRYVTFSHSGGVWYHVCRWEEKRDPYDFSEPDEVKLSGVVLSKSLVIPSQDPFEEPTKLSRLLKDRLIKEVCRLYNEHRK